jgi:hypothetical protein
MIAPLSDHSEFAWFQVQKAKARPAALIWDEVREPRAVFYKKSEARPVVWSSGAGCSSSRPTGGSHLRHEQPADALEHPQ